MAYKLALPPSLSCVHDVFDVSMLRKYITNSMHVIDVELWSLLPVFIAWSTAISGKAIFGKAKYGKAISGKSIYGK